MNDPDTTTLRSEETTAADSAIATLSRWLAVARRHRLFLIGGPAIAAALTVCIGLLLPRTYTVSALLVPQTSGGGMNRLAGVAAQFGVTLASPEAAGSPDFYASLIRSDQLLGAVVDTPIGLEGIQTLSDYYGEESESLGRRRALTVRHLRDDLSVVPDPRTGIVRVEVRFKSGRIGVSVVNRIIQQLNRVNIVARTSQASAERAFVEDRVGVARTELRTTERNLQQFLERNRNFQNSAKLQFEHDRLRRAVDTRQAVYTALEQGLEQARIDEVRNTPAIGLVAPPELPGLPDSRLLALKAIAAAVGTFLAVLGGLFVRDGLGQLKPLDAGGDIR